MPEINPIRSRLEALKQASALPVSGPVFTINDLMADLKISRRQVELLFENGAIASFKDGKRRLATQAARDDFVRRRIHEELVRLEALAE